jgi:prepilin-type N-terminal cleavage/methylation domain-containing protein
MVIPMFPSTDSIFRHSQKGFSIIEVLIAMAILSMAMLAAASMQFNSIRNNTSGNIVTQANMLAKAKMEEMKSTTDLNTLTNGADNLINAEGQPGGIYDRTWTVENLGATARRITVTVQWKSGLQSRSISISSNTRGNGV